MYLPDRTRAYSKQQGYVLLMAMMLLIMMATPFLYHASMETSNEMQRDQYQKIEQRLNDLKTQMILFAKYPGLFCADADNQSHSGYLFFPDSENDFKGYEETGFTQFKPYKNRIFYEPLIADYDSNSISLCDEDSGDSNGSFATSDSKVCGSSLPNLLLKICWVKEGNVSSLTQCPTNATTPTVYVYRNELGC